MKPVVRALASAAERLASISDTPRLDAELLMAEAFGIERDRLLLHMPDRIPPERFGAMVERRLKGEPVAYITGRKAFWNIELHVGDGVLVPRPDSEALIEASIDHFEGTAGPARILDLGTGPGTLLLAALDIWTNATGIGVDSSRRALSYATANARRLGLDDRADFRLGDWAEGIAAQFDLLLCNPPYVAIDADLDPGVRRFEPPEALFAGATGLDALEILAPQIAGLVSPGGLALIEIGHDQGRAGIQMLAAQGCRVTLVKDLAGRDRALSIRF